MGPLSAPLDIASGVVLQAVTPPGGVSYRCEQFDPFPDPVGPLWSPGIDFGFCRQCSQSASVLYIILPLWGSILQAGTCWIFSLAENPRWSRVWQYGVFQSYRMVSSLSKYFLFKIQQLLRRHNNNSILLIVIFLIELDLKFRI